MSKSLRGKLYSLTSCRDPLRATDLVPEGGQVSLEAFVFALQSLNTGQVVTVVVSVESLVLLLNPLFGFISVSVEARTRHR